DDQYEAQNDPTGGSIPSGVKGDNDYTSRTGQYQIPVQKDEAPVEDPINPATADSDQTLGENFLESWHIPQVHKTTKMPLISPILLAGEREEINPREAMLSLEMRKVCRDPTTVLHVELPLRERVDGEV
ncbi:MAG: hypothetical protein Q9186_000841, partial [Xanthomendoza sp. 1 TL-2023]